MSACRTRSRLLLSALALLITVAPRASADDVGLTSARLFERAAGGYALEADVAPAVLGALGTPVWPERFVPMERPTYRRVGMNLVVRWECDGPEPPLGPGDVLVLPWARSAVLLTARWQDGAVHRAMFPRGPAGIRVPIETLRPVDRSATEVARRHARSGLADGPSLLVRVLLVLALGAAAPGWRAVRLALVLGAGHALSMAALDLGVPGLAPAPALATVGLGAALLARSALRHDGSRLAPLVLAIGLVDGLGLAGALIRSGVAPRDLVPALFGAALLVDVAQVGAAALLAAPWNALRDGRFTRLATTAVGSFAIAATIAVTASGLQAGRGPGIDPAARLAAARLEFGGGRSTSAAVPGARATAPRELEEAALVFLSVEPREVRIEVLLRLRDFVEPLRIESGPGAVVPAESQADIAARAERMTSEILDVAIDGREVVPLSVRTDFVTVAATGVATRRNAEPVSLDSAALGVTLVYGVDRTPAEVTVRWDSFPGETAGIPAILADATGSERRTLTPAEPVLRWENDLSGFEPPPVLAVKVQPARAPLASVLLAGLALGGAVGARRRRRSAMPAALLLAGAIALYPFVRTGLPDFTGAAPNRAETAEVVDALLTNVYRSFEFREEEAIYDRLAVSVVGEQLSEVYLEHRRALELENRGGARARVDDVDVIEVHSVQPDGEGGVRVDAAWTVTGSVSHFGHVHYRKNRYDAALHLVATDGTWKIRGIEVREERRIL